jgi:Domain of unknown function (DUF3883)
VKLESEGKGVVPTITSDADLGLVTTEQERNRMTIVKDRGDKEKNNSLNNTLSTTNPLTELEKIGNMRESLLKGVVGLVEQPAIQNTDDTKLLCNMHGVNDCSTVAAIAPTGLTGEVTQYPISDQHAPFGPHSRHACIEGRGAGYPTGQKVGQGQDRDDRCLISTADTPLQLNFHAASGAHFEKQYSAELRDQESNVSMTQQKTISRIGEFMAYELLVYNMEKLGLCSVEWINRNQESTKPFDIAVRTVEGFVRYCEVLTTSRNHGSTTQWPISLEEVCAAVNIGPQYFAMCVRISSLPLFSRSGEQPDHRLEEAHLVGWDCGLAEGLHNMEACLLLQVGGGVLTFKKGQ